VQRIVFLILAFLVATPASACFGRPIQPVFVKVDNVRVDLLEAYEKKGQEVVPGVTVTDVIVDPEAPKDERAYWIILKKDGWNRAYRLVYPPVSRSTCNQPYHTAP
jgi:hypothetical protein